jgi:uncharacterized protein (DUF1800 family)
MTMTTSWRSRALLSLAVMLMTGCGGHDDTDMGAVSAATLAVEAPSAHTMAAAATPTLVVRARGTLAAGVGPSMTVRVDGNTVGTVSVTTGTDWVDYRFSAPMLRGGSKVEVVYTNDAVISGVDRNLYVASISSGSVIMLPTHPGAVIDRGSASAAFDGKDLTAGSSTLSANGALRLTWPAEAAASTTSLARRRDAARFLNQATFGPTGAALDELDTKPYATWITEQMALPVTDDYVAAVQALYDKGVTYRPDGAYYDTSVITRTFWRLSASAPDPLRRRVAFALHHIFMVSQADANLWAHTRAYAAYLDLLNRHAFGNFRTLLEEIALSPAMGIYLSHMRNRKEDPVTGRLPDENFAREIMQLFTIGLRELNNDGTLKLGSDGRPVETYDNDDVMALAKVFTGFSWGFADSELTEQNFRWSTPDYRGGTSYTQRVDIQRMKAYPGQHSTVAKTIFDGKPWAVTLPAGSSADTDLRVALDTLFKHPNVGPFIGRQLIQQLVTSQPSPAYVDRVASVFNNNGKGVRGDLGAVIRAILLDQEARVTPAEGSPDGKLREPALAIAQWMRAFGATSSTGAYNFAWQTEPAGQAPHLAPSVFGYFRPGYVPPNSSFSQRGATAPEFQIVNESTVAGWANVADSMGSGGLGWANNTHEIKADYSILLSLLTTAGAGAMLDEIDTRLLGGRMSTQLRQLLVDAMATIGGATSADQNMRVRMAVFLTLVSPEFRIQR